MAKLKLLPSLPAGLRAPTRPGDPVEKKGPIGHAQDAGIHAVDWVDERTSLSGTMRWVMFRPIPKGTNWFYTLGTATMVAFINQVITGIVLGMYYEPSATRAYESMKYINNEVFLGEFVHGMHRWGSTVMVVLIFLHMARTFFFGAYKYPRELNWVIGVVLLVLTLLMSVTGYLLPFDQRAYWASVVAMNIAGNAPIVGPFTPDVALGGPDVTTLTLSSFYLIHMMIIPGAIMALIGAHLYLVIKLGTTAPPWVRADKVNAGLKEHEG
jgi:quinol-cytochrome oxidoreductase complex cytochrome b subunit